MSNAKSMSDKSKPKLATPSNLPRNNNNNQKEKAEVKKQQPLSRSQRKQAANEKGNQAPQDAVRLNQLLDAVLDPTRSNSQMRGNIPQDVQKQLRALEKEFNSIKNETSRRQSPLQRSFLTGNLAELLHMYTDPGVAKTVPIPGSDPSSYIRGNFTPYKSLGLSGGLTRVIATPIGKYQLFASRSTSVEGASTSLTYGAPGNVDLWQMPKWVRQRRLNGEVVNTTVIEPVRARNPLADAMFITERAGMGCGFLVRSTVGGASLSLGIIIPDQYIGGDLQVRWNEGAGTQVTGVICKGGLLEIRGFDAVANAAANDSIVIGTAAGDITIESININFPDNFASFDPISFQTSYYRDGLNTTAVTFSNGVSTYDAKVVPTLVNLGLADLLGHGRFVAMSLLIGNDSSYINNAGFIYGATINDNLIPPSGVSFDDWVSSWSPWFYKGPARTGGYQIFVPNIAQEQAVDVLEASPWYSPTNVKNYNMVFIIDNSVVLNGNAPPDKIQCHVTLESIFQSFKLANIVPQQVQPADPGYELALSLLRRHYQPCCNPDHKDSIKEWLTGSFNGLVNYGANIITKDITPNLVSGAIDAVACGVPLLLSLL